MALKSAIVRQFGNPSGVVGALAGHIMARRTSNRIRNTRTVELMALRPDSRVLEVGCGPGLALVQCAAQVPDGRAVGLDHSPVMINQTRDRLRHAGFSRNVDLHVGGTERLGNWPQSFDRVFSLNVIQFIPDKAAYFRSVYAALVKGGMCFTTYQPRLDSDAPNGAVLMADDVTALMQSVGFQNIARAEINAGPKAAICVSGFKTTG